MKRSARYFHLVGHFAKSKITNGSVFTAISCTKMAFLIFGMKKITVHGITPNHFG